MFCLVKKTSKGVCFTMACTGEKKTPKTREDMVLQVSQKVGMGRRQHNDCLCRSNVYDVEQEVNWKLLEVRMF